jgi:uroporphyrinogen-III synthase
MGMKALVAPLFTVRPQAWEAPSPDDVDCVLLTSANGARHAGPRLAAFAHLPCFAVGESSAAAAGAAGFTDVRTGDSDGAALFDMAAGSGMKRPLHLCGRDHLPLGHSKLSVERRIVYASEAIAELPDAAVEALRTGALALLHSPRAAATFAGLVDQAHIERASVSLVGLSPAVAAAAGPGWNGIASAMTPSDDALLELAAKLCQTGGSATGNGG